MTPSPIPSSCLPSPCRESLHWFLVYLSSLFLQKHENTKFFLSYSGRMKNLQKSRTRGLFPHSLFCRRPLTPPSPQIRKKGLPQKLFMITPSVQTPVSGFTLSLVLGQEISEKIKKRKFTAGMVVVTVPWLDCLLILLCP